MAIKVGDAVFQRTGEVGIIRRIDENSGDLLIERDAELGKKDLRHGYVNGLNAAERSQLNEELDKAASHRETEQKVRALTDSIDRLRQEPKNFRLVQYLQSQLSHIMQTENYQPRTYTLPATSTE